LAAASGQAQSKVLPSKAYKYEDLPVRGSSRAVLNGETHSGFPIEMHITELPAGQPAPADQHVHEEVLMLRSGMLDATILGVTARA